jgi:hypothetical protein
MAGKFSLKMPDFHVEFRDLLHAVNIRHGTHRFTSLTKEGVLRIFFVLKNPTTSVGFEPATFGSKGQDGTSRPSRTQQCNLQAQITNENEEETYETNTNERKNA